MIRSDQPYIEHKYHIPFNPPPNEVNFVGGVGTNRGHRRSKVHPNRPTIVQQIYRMQKHNCIDVNFTQTLTETNNCVSSTRSMVFHSCNSRNKIKCCFFLLLRKIQRAKIIAKNCAGDQFGRYRRNEISGFD